MAHFLCPPHLQCMGLRGFLSPQPPFLCLTACSPHQAVEFTEFRCRFLGGSETFGCFCTKMLAMEAEKVRQFWFSPKLSIKCRNSLLFSVAVDFCMSLSRLLDLSKFSTFFLLIVQVALVAMNRTDNHPWKCYSLLHKRSL